MARPSGKPGVVIIEWGDTLSELAEIYGIPIGTLADMNGIENVDNIYENDELITDPNAAEAESTKPTNKGKVTITKFGMLATSSDPKLYAVWTWKEEDTTAHYEYEWEYTMGATGDTWWSGSMSTTKNASELECSYTIPSEAEMVRFRVKPVAKTTYKDGKESTPWTANWTNFDGDGKYAPFCTSSVPPETPSIPSVKIDPNDPYKLIAELNNVNAEELKATHIQFHIVRDNISGFELSGLVEIDTNYAYVSFTNTYPLTSGGEFKVRCRSARGSLKSEWTDYSQAVSTPPSPPAGFTVCRANSRSTDGKISVYLEWNPVAGATGYDIEYAQHLTDFDISDAVQTLVTGHKETKYESFNLFDGTNGGTYYLRFRAVKDTLVSEWSEASSVVLGKVPAAPTTWSSTTVASVGGPLNLYWVHNSSDGSNETYAQLRLEAYIQNELKWQTTIEIPNTNTADEDSSSYFDATKYLSETIPTYYKDGLQLRWQVRTSGVTQELGEWSIIRTVDIYASPKMTMTVRDASNTINTTYNTIGALPIHISVTTEPKTQAPIGFYLTVTANESYETVDRIGNNKIVNLGEEVYSNYIDQNTDLDDFILSAGDIDLESSVSYTLKCIAAMDSGLRTEASLVFTVQWEEIGHIPNAILTYDETRYVTQIRPYCNSSTETYYQAISNGSPGEYSITDTVVKPISRISLKRRYTASDDEVFTEILDGHLAYYKVDPSGQKVYVTEADVSRTEYAYTPTGERVFYGTANGARVYYCIKTDETPTPGVTLSVYRREFDGSFTELATGIDNTKNTYVTDPHPALDYARYRIVATADSTGAVGYYDMPAYPIQEKAIIIQWNEEWSNFDITGDNTRAQPAWSGSLLRLPYNVDVVDSYNMDVSHVEYIGRKRPVAYYGTQLGETSNWSVDIAKDDEETLYALRRLAIWPGNAYVREPSGTGYWATVTPSFSQKHKDKTIPVTLSIRRVEGGV